MRLIDADEFKKQIAGMAIVNNYPADKANKMCELIDCQPTAYDVDKVIERLKHDTEIALKRYMACNEDTLPVAYTRYSTQYKERRKCLEIFKSGGIT